MKRQVVILAAMAAPLALSAFQAPAAEPAPRAALTDKQKTMIKAAEADMAGKMASLAPKVGETAKSLNRALLAEKPDAELTRKLSDELAARVSEVVSEAIRLRVAAVQEVVLSLTAEQRALLLAELEKPGTDVDLLNVMKKVFPENPR